MKRLGRMKRCQFSRGCHMRFGLRHLVRGHISVLRILLDMRYEAPPRWSQDDDPEDRSHDKRHAMLVHSLDKWADFQVYCILFPRLPKAPCNMAHGQKIKNLGSSKLLLTHHDPHKISPACRKLNHFSISLRGMCQHARACAWGRTSCLRVRHGFGTEPRVWTNWALLGQARWIQYDPVNSMSLWMKSRFRNV